MLRSLLNDILVVGVVAPSPYGDKVRCSYGKLVNDAYYNHDYDYDYDSNRSYYPITNGCMFIFNLYFLYFLLFFIHLLIFFVY